jgi:hypothetical protein
MELFYLFFKLPQKDTLIGSILFFIFLPPLLTTRFNQIWYITNLTIKKQKKIKSFYMMVIYWILYYK